MMQSVYAEYSEYNKKYEARKEQLQRLIYKHTQALKRLEDQHQGWLDRVLVPLAVAIASELGGLPYEFYGPFGLSCETSVYFFPTDGHDITKDETYSLTVYPEYREGGYGYVNGFYLAYDTGRRLDTYRPGSIGDLNNFNNVKEELPDSLEEIVALLKHSHYEGEGWDMAIKVSQEMEEERK